MKTKTFLFLLLLLAGSIGAARPQDAAPAYSQPVAAPPEISQPAVVEQPVDYQPVPAVVYQAPVVYTAPVVYQQPVVYYAPVTYGTPAVCAPASCVAAPCVVPEYHRPVSTVTYIGGGHVGYQVSPPCNTGSTLVFIGGHSR